MRNGQKRGLCMCLSLLLAVSLLIDVPPVYASTYQEKGHTATKIHEGKGQAEDEQAEKGQAEEGLAEENQREESLAEGISLLVSFDAAGGDVEVSSQPAVSMQPYGELPVPRREGFSFVGWFTKEQGGEMVAASSLVEAEGDVGLYARWSAGAVYKGTMGHNQWEYALDTQTGQLSISGHGALLPEGSFPNFLKLMDAEAWKDQVTSLVIGSGITSFQNKYGATQVQFRDFPNLREARLPDSMENIKDVFYGCKNLEQVNIPKGLSALETNAFRNTKLKRVEVPGNVKAIANLVFEGCAELEEIVLGEGVEKIYPAFGGTAIKTLSLPASFKESVNMFQGSAIERVEVSPENPYMQSDGKAVYSKDGKEFMFVAPMAKGEFELLDTVESLSEYAFFSSSFSKITIPASIKEIPYDCFGSPSLEEVVLSEGVEKIASRAFAGWCENLKEVSIPNSVTEIGDNAFLEGVVLECEKDSVAHEYAKLFCHPFSLRDTASGLLRFDACGGNVEPTERPITQESCFCFLPVPERENYLFQGWYTKETGGTLVTEASRYAGGQSQTLYARWEGEKRFLDFYGNGGRVLGSSRKAVRYGDPYGALPEAYREGHRLKGWYSEPEGGRQIRPEDLSLETGWHPEWLDYITVEMYAQWETAETVKISFDANGGKIKLKEKFAVKGEPYGELPTPGRGEYTFQGWYTKASGGTEVTAISIADAPRTLYAHWKSIYPSYKITFDANGGKTKTASKTVLSTKTYGDLPKPERTGFQFEGWYTERAGGTEITSDSLVSITENQTLYAHWKANRYKVTFLGNGGSVDKKEMEVEYGSPYGALPVPKRQNYLFQGWYTKASGGSLVTDESIYQVLGGQTLHAHWEKQTMADYGIGSLSYSFCNSSDSDYGFGYPSGYHYPKDRFYAMFGKTQRAEELYQKLQKEGWGGNCYGMSATSSLTLTLGNGIYPGSFRPGASKMWDLKLGDKNAEIGMDLLKFIEVMHLAQYTKTASAQDWQTLNNFDALCEAVKAVGKTGYPVMVLMRSNSSGHAILAYKYEDMPDGSGRIYVYDCNFPGQERWIYIKKISNEKYAVGYAINDEDPVLYYSFCTYDTYYNIWKNRGNSVDDVMLSAASKNFEIYNGAGDLVGRVADGELESQKEGIYQQEWYGTTSEGDYASPDTVDIWLPSGTPYTIRNTDPDEQELEVGLTGSQLSSEVVTDSSEVTFTLEERTGENSVAVDAEEGEKYDVTLSSSAENDKEEVCLKGYGEGTEEVAISQIEGKVDYKGSDAALEVEGEAYPDIAVTATASKGGKISDSGRKEYPYKSYLEYTITPDKGYKVSDVLVDGVSVGAVTKYGFAELSYPHTIEAKFTKTEGSGDKPEDPGNKPENPGNKPENPGNKPENPGNKPGCKHKYKTAVKKATLKKAGSRTVSCTLCGKVKEKATIAKIKSVRMSDTDFTYTGKAIKPKITATDSKGKKIPSKYYTVTYKNNKQPGEATVRVKFKGDYSADMMGIFEIFPKGTKLTKVKSKAKAVTVQWKKQPVQTSGYQIQYSTNKAFKGKSTKLAFIKGKGKSSAVLRKLKGNKKYYIRIRTYKAVGKINYCSEWSKAKSVKVK